MLDAIEARFSVARRGCENGYSGHDEDARSDQNSLLHVSGNGKPLPPSTEAICFTSSTSRRRKPIGNLYKPVEPFQVSGGWREKKQGGGGNALAIAGVAAPERRLVAYCGGDGRVSVSSGKRPPGPSGTAENGGALP